MSDNIRGYSVHPWFMLAIVVHSADSHNFVKIFVYYSYQPYLFVDLSLDVLLCM